MIKKMVIVSDKKMLFLRLLLATLVLLDLLYAKLYYPQSDSSFDLFQIRFMVSLVLVGIFTATFFTEGNNRVLIIFTSIGLLINTFFELYLLVAHNFHYVNISEFLFTILISSLLITRIRYILTYLVFVILSFVVINIELGQPLIDIIAHGLLISMYSFVVLGFATLKLYFENKFRSRGDMVKYLFQDSQESMLLVDQRTLRIQFINNTTKALFALQQYDIVREQIKITDFFSSRGIEISFEEVKEQVKDKGYLFQDLHFTKTNGDLFSGNLYIKAMLSDDQPKWFIRISDLTEQHRAAERVKENWEMFTNILDAIPHKIFLKDPQSRFLMVNKLVQDVHGIAKDVFLGLTDHDLFPNERAQLFRNQEMEVMRTGKSISFLEEKVMMPDGTEKLFQITKMPFFLPEFNANGLFGLGIDVTQVFSYQEKLKKSEANYRMLMEQASDGIYSVDKYGIITDANPKACQMLGYTKGDLIGINAKSLTEEKDEQLFNLKQEEDKRSLILERRFKKKSGDVFIVELSVTILDDGGYQGIMRDITERKRMEKIVQDNEKKFRALIETSYDITAILDEQLHVTFISPSILKILGYMPKKLEGRTPFDLLHPEDQEFTEKFLSQLLVSPKEFKILPEIRIRHFNGHYRYFEVAGNNLMSDATVNGVVINLHDISERKTTETQLLNANYELDSFVYRVSHDIKAPLRSVMGLISIAKLENKQPEITTYLDMMNKSVLNLDQFIKDLTLFSRNSRMELDFNKIDFTKVVDECIENLKFMDNVDKVEIRKNIKPNIFFYSDLTRINTIIGNLLSNSLKYHKFEPDNSFVSITIMDENNQIVIKVEDNGVGINPEYQAKIFDMFFRASEKSYGSGLGLYIVKTAVKKLKGTIEVASVPNEGTTFKVVLPRLTVTNNNG